MATTPQKNMEIVSAQEKVKSKKDQMLENLKLEMLKDLKLDEKLAQRNAVMEKISEARKNNIFPTQIYFGGKEVEIKEQGKYKIIVAQYKKAQTEEEYKQLDKELSEQIILDQGKMIEFSSTEQFEGKTAEEEAKNTFERLEKNDKYNKKIELIKKTDGEVSHFIIKRTKKQLEEIERVERAYGEISESKKTVNSTAQNDLQKILTQLKKTKIGKIIELPIANGLIKLQKENQYGWKCITNTVDEFKPYVDRNKSDSYTSYVTNEDLEEFLKIAKKQKTTANKKIEAKKTTEGKENIGKKTEGKIGNKNMIIKNNTGTINITRGFDLEQINTLLEQIKNNIHAQNIQSTNQTINASNNQTNIIGTNTEIGTLKALLDEQYAKIMTDIETKFTEKLGHFEGILNDSLEKQKKETEELYKKQIEVIIQAKEDVSERIDILEKEYKEKIENLENAVTEKIESAKAEITIEIKKTNENIEKIHTSIEEIKMKISLLGERNEEKVNQLIELLKTQIKMLEDRIIALQKKLDECCEGKIKKQQKLLPPHPEQKLLPPHPEQKLLPPHPEQKLLPPHIEPTIEPVVEEGLGPVELTATISDTTQITRAIAERQAGEKLRKIYKNTARYKPRSWPTKATLFLGRGYMKDHYTRKFMNMQAGMQRDENLVKGADRHEMEEANKFNEKIENVGNIDEANYPKTYTALDRLAKELTGTNTFPNPRQRGISNEDFQKKFSIIIERNLDKDKPTTAIEPPTWKPIREIIKSNDIQQMSSNITEKLNAFRDHQEMADAIANRTINNPTESDTSFNAFSRDRIIKYFNTYKKNPEFLKTLNIKLDDPTAMKELRRLQSHNGALTQIAAQTMRLKVQILAKGEEAYNIKQEGNAMTKIGNRLDKPISDTSRFGKWLEKHPFAKNAFGTLRGVTKLGVMITPAILLAPLGPLAIASGAGGMAAIKTLFKKYAHYNKEHIGYQRNQAVNLLQNSQERERLMNEMTNINPTKRFMLYYFGLGKKARDVRQFRDYVMTTHDQLEDSKSLSNKIEGLLKKPDLTPQEQQDLEKYISAGLARLDYHKKTGQNFLGSQDKDRAEKEYQNIYRLVLTGSMRLDKELGDEQNPAAGTLRDSYDYKDEIDLIHNGTGDKVNQIGYQKSRKRFKYRQTEKALLGAVKAGGVAFGLSYLATSLVSSKASTDTLSGNQKVGDNFLLGKHQLAGDNQVYTQSKDFFGNAQSGHQTINFNYGGGTDATPVIGGHLNNTEYADKIKEVYNNISNMNNLSTATKNNLLEELNRKPREQVRAEKGFTNDYLQGMRCSEIIEQTAKGLNESGANAGNITLQAAYDGSVYDIVGHTYKNAGERVVQGALDYSQSITTPAQFIPIPVPAYMNTFKEADRYGEERQNNEERQGRKTRSPAPKREKQSTNDIPPRRRSGENTETTQFTHTNN